MVLSSRAVSPPVSDSAGRHPLWTRGRSVGVSLSGSPHFEDRLRFAVRACGGLEAVVHRQSSMWGGRAWCELVPVVPGRGSVHGPPNGHGWSAVGMACVNPARGTGGYRALSVRNMAPRKVAAVFIAVSWHQDRDREGVAGSCTAGVSSLVS